MKKDDDLRNIKRFNYSYGTRTSSFGWWVRFKRKREKFHQFFSDKAFGSEEKSLEAAKVYRNAIEIELGIAKVVSGIGGAKSKSGITGVNRAISISKKSYGTYTYYFWQAHWTNKSGKRESKRFSVSRWGEEEALRLAIEARKNGMAYTNIEEDLLFVPPDGETTKLWRYMDFTKFVAILENKGIFFPRADNLGDPFEGSVSLANQKFRPFLYKHTELFPDDMRTGELIKQLREWVVISCWHISNYESAGMWNLYAKSEEAICIQSTYKRLRSCLPVTSKIGLVRYVDYSSEWIPESNLLAPFMYKRKSFEHEKELRAVINLKETEEDGMRLSAAEEDPPTGGIWVPTDLHTLIEKVYVAPYAHKWFGELIRSVVRTYSLDKPVIKSSLDDEPIF
jgi:hypothetical protein